MTVRAPENFSVRIPRHRDKYLFILNSIFRLSRFVKSDKDNPFVSLSSEILHKILGGRYKTYVQELIDTEVIETDNQYIESEKSKGYRLTKKYKNKKFIEAKMVDKNIIRKIKEFEQNELRVILKNPTYRYLYNNLLDIEIDSTAALEYIFQNSTSDYQQHYLEDSITLFEQKKIYFKTSKSGRVYTNITSLKRELRKFLSHKSNPLIEVDIANSQPLLFLRLVYDYINSNTNRTIIPPQESPYLTQNEIDPTYLTAGVKQYKELVERGELYFYLMNEFGVNDKTYADFKTYIFAKIFFFNPVWDNEEFPKFRSLFPTVAAAIYYYKENDYRYLPNLLHKMEADLIINSVAPRLKELGIFIQTIHDSILTTPDNSQIVKQVIEEKLNELYELKGTVRIKGVQ